MQQINANAYCTYALHSRYKHTGLTVQQHRQLQNNNTVRAHTCMVCGVLHNLERVMRLPQQKQQHRANEGSDLAERHRKQLG